jgi:hypothetical protein
MNTSFDPYKSRIAVSTGSKGVRKFDAGRIKMLKNEWKLLGVNIVPIKTAEYVIVPDGSSNRGKSGRFATLINYSDFTEMLRRSKRIFPIAPLGQTTPARHRVMDIVKHDMTFLERRLTASIDDSVTYHRIQRANELEFAPIKVEPKESFQFQFPSTDYVVVKKAIDKLKSSIVYQ